MYLFPLVPRNGMSMMSDGILALLAIHTLISACSHLIIPSASVREMLIVARQQAGPWLAWGTGAVQVLRARRHWQARGNSPNLFNYLLHGAWVAAAPSLQASCPSTLYSNHHSPKPQSNFVAGQGNPLRRSVTLPSPSDPSQPAPSPPKP